MTRSKRGRAGRDEGGPAVGAVVARSVRPGSFPTRSLEMLTGAVIYDLWRAAGPGLDFPAPCSVCAAAAGPVCHSRAAGLGGDRGQAAGRPYPPDTVWRKVRNGAYTQMDVRRELFHRPE